MTQLPIGPEANTPTCIMPDKREHVGRSVRLVPLSQGHAPDLWQAAQDADESWTYLGYGPFRSFEDFERHVDKLCGLTDQPFFAVIPSNGCACGWLSYCDIEPVNAAIEIGSIWFSPRLQRTRAATEAIYLLLDHAFFIGFNRIAWRCNALNMPSRKAAERLGFVFEGTWRMAQIIKGRWRDTSWYSQIVEEWPANKPLFERWLTDSNFGADGSQRSPLR
jgi:RimJ/RimL family protein N-acetyltransferase